MAVRVVSLKTETTDIVEYCCHLEMYLIFSIVEVVGTQRCIFHINYKIRVFHKNFFS